MTNRIVFTIAGMALAVALLIPATTFGKSGKKRARRHYPPITHPVVLWSRTLGTSTDAEQRRIAAFKLSQYSQPIYQEEVIAQLVNCSKDPDNQIKVLCTKAMGHAGNSGKAAFVRKALLEIYENDPSLRDTLTRVFIVRKDSDKSVQNVLLETLKKSVNAEETLVLLSYFQELGMGLPMDPFIDVYNRTSDTKVKRATIQVLSERAEGQPQVVEILAQCAESKDTPLSLNCLAGLQLQAKHDARAWTALEKTIQSSDPDMLLATLDVINVLPQNPSPVFTKRLIEITNEFSDSEILDKAVLALGVCGDHSQAVVDTLGTLMAQKDTEESTKIHVALVLGRQGDLFPDKLKDLLGDCLKTSTTQSLKTACQLSGRELDDRIKLNAKKGTPTGPAPASIEIRPGTNDYPVLSSDPKGVPAPKKENPS